MEHFYRNIQGWFAPAAKRLYRRMVEKAPDDSPSRFVEVGSWKGRSAAFMAVEMENSGKDISLFCVDHWLGSNEADHHNDPDLPRLYEVFTENLGKFKRVIPLKMDSIAASEKFEDGTLDFVFIDASHEYEDVKRDILAWTPKVKPGGTIAGDDFNWPGVNRAVKELVVDARIDRTIWRSEVDGQKCLEIKHVDLGNVKLGVVVPGDSKGPFFTYLTSLIYTTGNSGVEAFVINPRGSDLVQVRTAGAITAIDLKATHILWVDSDILMPQDAAIRLLGHGLPIVAANYVMKRPDHKPVTCNNGERIRSVGKSGLEKVTSTGMGLMLTDVSIYHKMMFPWFGHRWFPRGQTAVLGVPSDMDKWPASFEDNYFCDRASQAGFDVYIDHDLSLEVGHYGSCVFYHDTISIV